MSSCENNAVQFEILYGVPEVRQSVRPLADQDLKTVGEVRRTPQAKML